MRPSFLRPRDRGNHKESAACLITKASNSPYFHIPLIFFILYLLSHAVSEIFSLFDTFSHLRNLKKAFNVELLYHKNSNMCRPLNKLSPVPGVSTWLGDQLRIPRVVITFFSFFPLPFPRRFIKDCRTV